MTLQELGSLGELLAALATLATLIYLAAQIRQSNRANQMASIARFAEASEAWINGLARDPEVYAIYRKGLTAPATLSREERGRFDLLVVSYLRSIETGWYQRRWGLVDAEFWEGYANTTRLIVGSPGGRAALARNRDFFAPGFAEEIDTLLGSERVEEVAEG